MTRLTWQRLTDMASLATVIVGFIAIGLIHGCAQNPVSGAQTPEQKAYALYGTFTIVEQQAASAIQSGQLTPHMVNAIQLADARAKPTADALLTAVQQYDQAAGLLAAGGTTADKVAIAQASLSTWLTQAAADIQSLTDAMKGTPK